MGRTIDNVGLIEQREIIRYECHVSKWSVLVRRKIKRK